MIICINEYPDDNQAQVWFMDTDKIDTTNSDHVAYKAAVDKALVDQMEMSTLSNDYGFFEGMSDMRSCSIWPPCSIDRQITIYLE